MDVKTYRLADGSPLCLPVLYAQSKAGETVMLMARVQNTDDFNGETTPWVKDWDFTLHWVAPPTVPEGASMDTPELYYKGVGDYVPVYFVDAENAEEPGVYTAGLFASKASRLGVHNAPDVRVTGSGALKLWEAALAVAQRPAVFLFKTARFYQGFPSLEALERCSCELPFTYK